MIKGRYAFKRMLLRILETKGSDRNSFRDVGSQEFGLAQQPHALIKIKENVFNQIKMFSNPKVYHPVHIH